MKELYNINRIGVDMFKEISIYNKYLKEKETVSLKFARYKDRDKIVIIAHQEGKLYDYLLTFDGDSYCGEDVVSFRSDCPEYIEALIEGKIIEPDLIFLEPYRKISLEYYKLTSESFKEISKKLKDNNLIIVDFA